jgi:hypothetical protein
MILSLYSVTLADSQLAHTIGKRGGGNKSSGMYSFLAQSERGCGGGKPLHLRIFLLFNRYLGPLRPWPTFDRERDGTNNGRQTTADHNSQPTTDDKQYTSHGWLKRNISFGVLLTCGYEFAKVHALALITIAA